MVPDVPVSLSRDPPVVGTVYVIEVGLVIEGLAPGEVATGAVYSEIHSSVLRLYTRVS